MRLLPLLSVLLLNACNQVTVQHIAMAQTLCAPNGGLVYIDDAETGRNWYEMIVKCSNGAKIEHYWEAK